MTHTSTSWHQKWLAIKGLQQSHCNPMSWAADAHGLLSAGCPGKNRGRAAQTAHSRLNQGRAAWTAHSSLPREEPRQGAWWLKAPQSSSGGAALNRWLTVHTGLLIDLHSASAHISHELWGDRIWDQCFCSIFCHAITNVTNFMHCSLAVRNVPIYNGSLKKARNAYNPIMLVLNLK